MDFLNVALASILVSLAPRFSREWGLEREGDVLFCDSDKTWHGVAGETGFLEAGVEVLHEDRFGDVDCEGCGACLAVVTSLH